MDPLAGFFAWPTLLLALAVYGATHFVRRELEDRFKGLKGNTRVWGGPVLTLMPVLFGVVIVWLVRTYPVPAVFATDVRLRIFFGATIGGASSLLYKVIKAMVKKTWGVDLSAPPPAVPKTPSVIVPPSDALPSIAPPPNTDAPASSDPK